MYARFVRPLVLIGVLLGVCGAAEAATISEFTAGTNTGTFFIGQSVTTPSGSSWNQIEFNWFDATFNPIAVGTLFVYTQEFIGAPSDLSAAGAGFVGQSTGIVANRYIFPSVVALLSGTHGYFFYANAAMSLSGSGGPGTLYPGGSAYFSDGAQLFFTDPQDDGNFRLSGVAVPEPATGLLLMAGVAVRMLRRRR